MGTRATAAFIAAAFLMLAFVVYRILGG